ncbi:MULTISPECIES: DNA cytosine methyltransferase [Acinetobacter]|uniref:Cytosine-specific methyltransferase n=2 Tax=Acinetobacter baumannii TaxID=470 RepID=A0A6I4HRV3_ACIBA|nr:DNA cytosine methyltransferase [Acinetobacter baumannii]MCO9048499.1 DNA cytosine methyltransferase [Acinetobacter sp. UC24323]AYY89945.1 DNA cytosine methyltransferase [Acinetobacter baumannii]KAF0597312.1 DNA cytosine methyltransferase [Acinetobacter baumannii]KAF0628062.1 DNA cytosine methyltransferase [Acinetobacter baumannii]KJX74326.1 cytosine methyltransferase [Acinetobacter baumannii]
MKYGSVCSGIEAATVAWHDLGLSASWFSEIEKFPSQVLQHHYPDILNLGDMTLIRDKVKSGEVEAPDILVGGTPCQAFSIAGLKNSLNDDRGQLTLEFVRLADEIDSARTICGLKPAIIVWENVPGVLNTKDNAFGCFLGALSGSGCELQPAGKKWTNAGCVFGPSRQVAWRVLDAQYFGVAQRRKRVFVVASAREGSVTKVLFEQTGMLGNPNEIREAKKNNTEAVAKCLTRRGAGGQNLDAETATFVIHGTQDPLVNEETAHCLGRNRGQENAVLTVNKTAATLTRGFGDRGIDADQITNGNCAIQFKGVRRLTPVECERLQGFPDQYTNIPNAKDSPRYAALGNSMAVPVMRWIGERLLQVFGEAV